MKNKMITKKEIVISITIDDEWDKYYICAIVDSMLKDHGINGKAIPV